MRTRAYTLLGLLGLRAGQADEHKTLHLHLFQLGHLDQRDTRSAADVGDIEMQAQFVGVDIPETESFQFSIFRVQAGELERVPIQLSAFARFRPRASFNPYVGGGVGYTIIGFEPSEEFNALSRNLDASRGGFAAGRPVRKRPRSFLTSPSFWTSLSSGLSSGASGA